MNQEKNKEKAFIWNMIGSTCYSAASFLYLIAVTRVCGVEIAGFFSLSYATSQLLLQVGRYGMRTFQSTDLEHRFFFSEYCASRVISCLLMLGIGTIYSIFSFRGEYIVISIFIIFMKMIDAVEDVFHGNLQQKYHVEEMGKSLAARNVFTAVLFTASLLTWHSLYLTSVLTATASLALCLIVNLTATGHCLKGTDILEGSVRQNQLMTLMKICSPLFAGTFLSLLIYNIPKYAMAGSMSDEFQTYYSIMFMPSFVIILMSEFTFKPFVTTIAGLWMEKLYDRFIKYILIIIGTVAVIDVAIVIAGHLIGRRILELVYKVDLSPYKLHFVILLIGGGLSAEVYILYNILRAIRHEKLILPVYAFAAAITAIVVIPMIRLSGMLGACFNYLFSCSILFASFVIVLISAAAKQIRLRPE